MKNAVGRIIPDELLAGGKEVYQGKFYMDGRYIQKAAPKTRRCEKPQDSKLLPSLAEALRQCGAKDGMTFSFHHHLRDGDWDTLRAMLPETSLAYFRSQEAADVLAAIRRADTLVHY